MVKFSPFWTVLCDLRTAIYRIPTAFYQAHSPINDLIFEVLLWYSVGVIRTRLCFFSKALGLPLASCRDVLFGRYYPIRHIVLITWPVFHSCFLMTKSKTKRKNKKRSGERKPPPPSATSYRGPITTSAMVRGVDLYVFPFHYTQPIGSTALGVIAQSFSNNGAGAANWASIAACFDGYRTLGFKLKFIPSNRYSKVTTLTNPIGTCVDYEDTTVPTTITDINVSSSFRLHSLDDPFSVTARMFGIDCSAFVPTASPVNTFVIKMFASGLSASTDYGYIDNDYLLEFRSLGK